MEALLHIGMHKTGTTSIQRTLGSLPSLGERHFYVDLGPPNHSVPLFQMFALAPHTHPALARRGVSAEQARAEGAALRESVSAQLRAAGPHRTPVFSGEDMSSTSVEILRGLRDFLAAHGYRAAVRAYVRPAAGFISSSFQQRLKVEPIRFSAEDNYPGYRRRFEPVESVFGRDAIRYWLFDPAQLAGGNAVTDFCQRCGLPLPPPEAIVRANESLSRTAVALLYLQKHHAPPEEPGPEAVRLLRRIQRVLQGIAGPRFVLGAALVEPVLREHAGDLAWMTERLPGADLGGLAQEGPEAVQSEAHLIELGLAAMREQAARLGMPRPIREPADIDRVMRRLLREMAQARRQAQSDASPAPG